VNITEHDDDQGTELIANCMLDIDSMSFNGCANGNVIYIAPHKDIYSALAYICVYVRRGGSVVGSVPCVRKVAVLNPTLAAMYEQFGKSFTHSCLLRFGVLNTAQHQCCNRERL